MQAYALDDFDEVMTWLHETHDTVADTVEIVALTKTDPALAAEPVLLVTGLALVADAAEADAGAGAVPHLPGAGPGAAGARRRAHDAGRAAQAPARGQPRGPPLGGRQRLAVRPGGGGRAGDAPRVHDAAEREGVHDLVQHGAAAAAARHGVLAAVGDLPGDVRAVGVAEDDDHARRGWPASMADLEPVTVGQYLGDSDLTRRQVQFMSDENWSRLQEIRAERDPDGLFVGYLAGRDGALTATTGSSCAASSGACGQHSATSSSRANSHWCAGSESRSAANQ